MSDVSPRKPTLITLILLASINVVTLNMFLPALPDMARDFGVSFGLMSWAFSGYLLVVAAMQLIVGPLSDYFGRRPVLIGCFVIYIPASLGCMLAPTVEIFFACRVLQGVIIGAVGTSHAIIRDTEPSQEHAASRLATVVMVMAIMPMLAPLVGGMTADAFGWRSNFLLMTVLGAFILGLVLITLDETNRERMSTFGQQIRAYPTLLNSQRFWAFALTVVFNVGIFYVFLVGIPVLGKANYDLSRTEIGLLLAYVPLGYMVGNSIVRVAVQRLAVGTLVFCGRLIGVASVLGVMLLLSLNVSNPFVLFLPLVFMGLANGLIMPTSTSGAISVNPRLAGTASGLVGAMMQFCGAGLTAVGSYTLTQAPSVWTLLSIMLVLAGLGVFPALILHRTADPTPSPNASNPDASSASAISSPARDANRD